MMYTIAVFFVVFYSSVTGAPVQEQGCDVESFRTNVLSGSLLLDNDIACSSNGGKLKAKEFCQHMYKCPLDLTSEVRSCEAVCRENGTWEYQYPTCSDMLPLADSIMNALQEDRNDPDDDEDLTQLKPESDSEGAKTDTNILSRVRRWSFYKPPPRKLPPTTTTEEPTTTTTIATTTKSESHNDTDFSWVEQYCGPQICSIANSLGCNVIAQLKLHPDYQIQTTLCKICMMMDYCPTSMGLFGTRV